MVVLKCCVGGCDSKSTTHRLFCFPENDKLRSLWLKVLIPKNPALEGLAKTQLKGKRVCEKHFDKTQFDRCGVRIRYSCPSLFTPSEILHGVPFIIKGGSVENEHDYFRVRSKDVNQTPPPKDIDAGKLGQTPVPLKVLNKVPTQDHQSSSMSIPPPSSPPQPTPPPSSPPPTRQISFIKLLVKDAVSSSAESERINTCQRESAGQVQTGKPKTKMTSKTLKYIKESINLAKESADDTSSQRLQSAQNLIKDTKLISEFEKLGDRAKTFLLMQLRLATKKKMARRFSENEKLFALTLWKQSPKSYKLLENMFALPNRRTLIRLSSRKPKECDVNNKTFDHLKEVTQEWDIKKRLCTLVFDEVPITSRYSIRKMKGIVKIAEERQRELIKHVLVFMVRGICSTWTQRIKYYCFFGTISTAHLQNILKGIIPRLRDSGLIPLAVLCNHGPPFRLLFKALKEETALLRSTEDRYGDNTIHIAGSDLFFFFDPPRLLKGIRNNFVKNDIIFHNKRASWRDIMYVYDLDNRSGHTRALPGLRAEHVDPQKLNKMKVKTAAQVLSAETAAMLEFTHSVYKDLNCSLETMEATAEVVLFFSDLFDSVSGAPGGLKGKLRNAVKKNSPHADFWRKAISKLKIMGFSDTSSEHALQHEISIIVRVPSLEGWIETLKSFLGLTQLLLYTFGVESFYPRYLNQDVLEKSINRIKFKKHTHRSPPDHKQGVRVGPATPRAADHAPPGTAGVTAPPGLHSEQDSAVATLLAMENAFQQVQHPGLITLQDLQVGHSPLHGTGDLQLPHRSEHHAKHDLRSGRPRGGVRKSRGRRRAPQLLRIE
ncbi:uncharacterized protein LOC124637923 isoform X2 [Helicoverpa zea]|uniref:uncharacterized protein LOC124637923 isoform X2 n=1 Tax=Helicoverpa zea TaxID=7113 RepID=UPI001F56F6EF|nr:uncharacterized protein LOC124637923 isoform X2 [Helicoverpa zea]